MKQQFKPNILIIDDEASICESLQGILEDEGYNVVTACSGEAGIRFVASEQIDLVFLDILMPGGFDGIETLRRIKQISADTEVIMITGHGTFELALEAGSMGAFDFLGKPLSLDIVLAKVEEAVQKIERRRTQLAQENSDFERPIIGTSPTDAGNPDKNSTDRADQWARPHHRRKRHWKGIGRLRRS